MAGADYRSCDVCGTKAFYDANLQYYYRDDKEYPGDTKYAGEMVGPALFNVGNWAVICRECSKTHRIEIWKNKRKVKP